MYVDSPYLCTFCFHKQALSVAGSGMDGISQRYVRTCDLHVYIMGEVKGKASSWPTKCNEQRHGHDTAAGPA